MEFFWDNWFLLALCAPALWALVNIIDVYFVEDIYERPLDGIILSGLFQIVPWVAVPLGILEFYMLPVASMLLFLLGGFLYMAAFYFYFKALFQKNDAPLVQVLWTLSLPLVPIFSWIVFGEQLLLIQYAGIFITFLGGFFLSLDSTIRSDRFWLVAKIMILANVSLAASMVIQSYAYEVVGENGFWSGYLLFSLGAFLVAPLVWIMSDRHLRVFRLARRYWLIFLLSEGLATLGFLASQRALSLSISPSFVAVLETLIPAFVMVFSILTAFFLRIFHFRSLKIQALYQEQFRGILVKSISIGIIAFGIYLL